MSVIDLCGIRLVECDFFLPSFVTNTRLYRKLYYQTTPSGTSVFLMLSSE